MTSVQTTVKSDFNTWSSVLRNAWKIKAPLKPANEEKDRCSNLVICGLPEKKDIVQEAGVLEVLEHVDEKPRIISCFRMGRAASDGERAIKPIRFMLSS